MRHDLIALTEDDLITQSNRGIVKRQASKDLDNLMYEIAVADDDTVTVSWSDDVTVILPADKTLLEVTQENDPTATKLSRQVVRSVMAYQQWIAEQPQNDNSVDPLPQPEVWNPALIDDAVLEEHYGKAKLAGIRREYENGHVLELVRSTKPTARFHTASVTVRFLVPMDFRYTHCDCDEIAPCRHVPMAIWAFRDLPEEKPSGIVETLPESPPIPETLIADIRNALLDFAELGLSGTSKALIGRFEHLIKRCEDEGLIWHSDILRDFLLLHQQYHAQDSQFSPLRLAEVLGELMIRLRAVENPSRHIPAIFVRGSASSRETTKGTSALMGLGCTVDIHKKGVTLSAYMQDSGSGQTVAIQKYFADPEDDKTAPQAFSRLGLRNAMKGTAFASIGNQRYLIQGGKYSSNATFNPGRAKISANPQNYQWENLRAPLLVADFDEVIARQSAQPPKSLRPRRVGESIVVCPIERVNFAGFDNMSQSIVAMVQDSVGGEAMLQHPFTSRGNEGAEKLMWWLTNHPEDIRFVAGDISIQQGGLMIAPIAVVFEVDGKRHGVQPWVDKYTGDSGQEFDGEQGRELLDPTHYYPSEVAETLGEIFTLGITRLDAPMIRQLEHLCNEGERLGFSKLLAPIVDMTRQFADKQRNSHWDWQKSAQRAFDVLLLLQFARERSQ